VAFRSLEIDAMSIGSLGIVAGLAGSPLSQRVADVERAERESADKARETKAEQRAEQSAGIGQTEEDSQAGERDADGRRPWEHPTSKPAATETPATTPATTDVPALVKDPTGERGSELDLVG
jgi:hypothetical protein